MKNNRIIRIIGTIDEESFKAFSEQMNEYELKSTKLITIELSSGGGSAYDALAFSGRMRNSSCPTIVKAFGYVASAAVIILASGTTRLMAKEAWVMVHQDSGKLKGFVVDHLRESAHMQRMEDQWNKLLSQMTKIDEKDWANLHKKTTYLCAAECLNYGLVDKLI